MAVFPNQDPLNPHTKKQFGDGYVNTHKNKERFYGV